MAFNGQWKKEVGKAQDNKYSLGNNFNSSKAFTESYERGKISLAFDR